MKAENIVSTSFQADNAERTLILACQTIFKEVESAMDAVGLHPQITYLRSSLHDTPSELNTTLQELINEAGESGVKQILLGYATCGNSIAGLYTGKCRVIVPRLDDCVTLFLGSMERRRSMPPGTFFLTYGWLYGEGHGRAYYDFIIDKYGEEDGEEILDMMFENYRQAGLIDTHCYPMEQIEQDAKEYAGLIGKDLIHIDGDNAYLEQLLTGPWPEDRFLVFEPDHTITEKELLLN